MVKDFQWGLTLNSYINMKTEYSCKVARTTLLINFKTCYLFDICEIYDSINQNKSLEPVTYYSCNHTQIYGFIENFSMI